jgi:PAS domain S-box-containing protein
MAVPLRVLILEDSPADAELMLHELRRAGFDPDWVRVDTEADYCAALETPFDVVLADYSLPQYDALRALRLLQDRALDIPFIVVTGSIGEEAAVTCMKQGAADYLLKDRLARLGPVVGHALEQRRLRDEKRQMEERLRLQSVALESAPTGVVITDREGRMTWVNHQFTHITGYTADEVLGQTPRLLKSGKHDQSFYQHLWETILSGQVWRGEFINRRKDGSLYIEEEIIAPVRDARGTISHFIGVHQDITERKRIEEALQTKTEQIREMTQQLWQTAKLATVGELAASIAHELNNPLATVNLRLEWLLAQIPDSDPRRRALEVIEQEVERMGNLVANLLQFTRRGQPQVSTLDVRDQIEQTLELIYYHLRNRGISVVREFAPHAPMIQADRQQLRQLFLNLFTNASDAMPQGGTLTLRVRVGERESGGKGEASPAHPLPHSPNHVVIEVADTGVGIAPEDLPKVMEPFFTTKPEGMGTGLGLAICRRIVQEHQGTMEILSEVGRGTTVRIVLPVANRANGTHLSET